MRKDKKKIREEEGGRIKQPKKTTTKKEKKRKESKNKTSELLKSSENISFSFLNGSFSPPPFLSFFDPLYLFSTSLF